MPPFISIVGLLKATPSEEWGERYLYFEASNEDTDLQGEIILQQALKDSSPYFLRHGNIDISHFTLIGRELGIANPLAYEIGTPLDVRVGGGRTYVKAELYQGDSLQAVNAGMVWDSLTKQRPPMRWYPSVGGQVITSKIKIDDTGKRVKVVDKVRWSNVALDRMPVNATVPEVSTVPIGVFAKGMGGFVLAKTLEAGYGTDSAALTGGAALRQPSLQGCMPYLEFRGLLSKKIRRGDVGNNPDEWVRVGVANGIPVEASRDMVKQFIKDLQR